jgi:hypothetical protein
LPIDVHRIRPTLALAKSCQKPWWLVRTGGVRKFDREHGRAKRADIVSG